MSGLLEGDLRRTVFLLALPVLCEQFLHYLVGLTDTWLSGRISSAATSAVGLGAYVGWLASLFFSLVGTGTTALVARHWGAGEFDAANRVVNRSVALAGLLGAAFYALLFVLAPLFARLLEMHGDTGQVVVRYLRLDGIGYVFLSVSTVGAAALRGSGDMRTPMLVLGLVNVVNVAVSTSLVFGLGPIPPIGIDGIVIGTVVARFGGGLLILGVLARGSNGLRLIRRELRVRGETVRRILRIGVPAGIEGAVMWSGHFVFLMIIANLAADGRSSDVFAAHMVGIRVEALTYLPAVAWGAAAATLIGQSLGAGRPERAMRGGHEAALQCSALAVLISIAFYAGARPIYELMHTDDAVREIGVAPFRLLALFQVPLVWSIVYVFALRGAGDTRFPLVFTLFGTLLVRLPVAYVCGIVLDGGLFGAWIGMCGDVAVRAVFALVRFSRGRWTGVRI
ncbi:MAG TPA: MATE family efflux transporter [Planctomycetaceae bacterium]|nr:MATE family efflux transporter [Planctomycetaceae bacterium]